MLHRVIHSDILSQSRNSKMAWLTLNTSLELAFPFICCFHSLVLTAEHPRHQAGSAAIDLDMDIDMDIRLLEPVDSGLSTPRMASLSSLPPQSAPRATMSASKRPHPSPMRSGAERISGGCEGGHDKI